ncbi:MAG: hypothetical protein WB810_15520 [Candidatus Cybelea sp.]
MLLALVITSAVSLPSSVQHALLASATASPAPSPNVPCEGRCLSGIAVGDDAKGVLARLDSRPIPGSDERIMADFNSYPDGLMLTVYYYRGTVVAVSITSTKTGAQIRIADPYGIRLGDPATRLTSARGNATSAIGDVLRYGPADGIHWDYTVDADSVTTILVSSVPSLQ